MKVGFLQLHTSLSWLFKILTIPISAQQRKIIGLDRTNDQDTFATGQKMAKIGMFIPIFNNCNFF